MNYEVKFLAFPRVPVFYEAYQMQSVNRQYVNCLTDTGLLDAVERLIQHRSFVDLDLGYESGSKKFYAGCEYADDLRGLLRTVLVSNRPTEVTLGELVSRKGAESIRNTAQCCDTALLDEFEKLLTSPKLIDQQLGFDLQTKEFFLGLLQGTDLRDVLRQATGVPPPGAGHRAFSDAA